MVGETLKIGNAREQDQNGQKAKKLHGRAFYESIGSPKFILAPMVDQSEFAWRMLSRSFMPSTGPLLTYTPMFHARLFAEKPGYREHSFQPVKNGLYASSVLAPEQPDQQSDLHLDGNPAFDRPLFVQFCANDPDFLLEAAKHVQPFCDAVDLNLGCPQGIARKGHYGAFLQEDWDLVYRLINRLHQNLDVPVTAKMRILETKEKTLEYAKKILSAGASIITVHGRRREQKGHNTGIADWSFIRHLRENLPPETVIFANGNILQYEDIQRCLDQTGADGIMSAEGNLHDPAIFAPPPPIGQEGREYWRGRDGKGGWRMDAVMRRYLDIIYHHVLETEPPERKPLFMPSDPIREEAGAINAVIEQEKKEEEHQEVEQPARKKRKRDNKPHIVAPSLSAMQSHLFSLLRPLVSKHTDIRDLLARSRAGNIEAFETILQSVEAVVKEGLLEYERAGNKMEQDSTANKTGVENDGVVVLDDAESSDAAVARCERPWWVCQSYVRPLPKEAIAKGAMQPSKKAKKELAEKQEAIRTSTMDSTVVTSSNPSDLDISVRNDGLVAG